MFGYVSKEKYKELEEVANDWKNKYEQAIYNHEHITKQNDRLFDENVQLKQELIDSKATTLPDSRFNISKAVTLLTTKLSDKALAKFCFEFTEELQKSKYSHLVSLNTYTLKQLSKNK